MSVVAWAAFFLSLVALFLFLISNYKSIYNNTVQFFVDPDLRIRLKTGSTTFEDGTVTVGGPSDDFERELIKLQDEQENRLIKIPLSQLQHPDDHSEVDHFSISIVNGDDRAYKGRMTVISDFLIQNQHPDVPPNLQEMSESYLQLEKRLSPPGTMIDSETLGPKARYEFDEKALSADSRSSSSWYIDRDILTPESDSISEFEIKIEFEPRLTPPNFPWWIPEFVGSIELRPIKRTFVITDDLNHP
jgi:hypothetical protein